jgi:hypothetical protein
MDALRALPIVLLNQYCFDIVRCTPDGSGGFNVSAAGEVAALRIGNETRSWGVCFLKRFTGRCIFFQVR